MQRTETSVLSTEAERALRGNYPENESGLAARLTMAIVNNSADGVEGLIQKLIATPAGREAIITELAHLSRESWYRSFADLIGRVPSEAFQGSESRVGQLVAETFAGTSRLGVTAITAKLSSAITLSHPGLSRFLYSDVGEPLEKEPLDSVVHQLRDSKAGSVLDEALREFPADTIVASFNSYLSRGRFAWAAELLDFCYLNPVLREQLEKADAVTRLTRRLTETASVVSLRFLAEVVRDRPEYKRAFCESLRIREW